MKIDENFKQCLSDAKKWMSMDHERRNYADGVEILIKSGFKRNLAIKLKRIGPNQWTSDSLRFALQELINMNKTEEELISDKTDPSPLPSVNSVVRLIRYLGELLQIIKNKYHATNKRVF